MRVNEKWTDLQHNSVLVKDGWYLSYNNDPTINCDGASELAIAVAFDDGEKKKTEIAILYYANPEDFENFDNYEDALALGRKLVTDGKCRTAFWSGYDFGEGKWYWRDK